MKSRAFLTLYLILVMSVVAFWHVAPPTVNAQTRVGAITLTMMEASLCSAVIDAAGGFAYFGTDTLPGMVVKVRLSDLTRIGALTMNSGENNLRSAVIDAAGGFAYFGTGTSPGMVVKIRLSDFTRVGAITLNPGENNLRSAVIDASGGFAYFGTGTSPGMVVKIRLSDFSRVGALELNSGENNLCSAVIDASGGFAYFGTWTSPGTVVKVRLSDLTRIGALTLNSGENNLCSAVIDAAGGFVYFGTGTWPGIVVKVNVARASRVLSEASTMILSASANSVYFICADPNRMVSAPPTPWQAAFAAYDATAAGFIYGLCANSQVICYDSNGTIVVAKDPPDNPPFNYGTVLPSSKRVVVVGGPTPNWVVDYYERTGQTPLKFYRGTTDYGFQTQTGTVVASISKTTDWAHNDLFVVMTFQDSNGNFVLIIYGVTWKGTFAGGIFLKEVIKPNLATYTKSAYIFRWSESVSGDGVPQASEITQVYST